MSLTPKKPTRRALFAGAGAAGALAAAAAAVSSLEPQAPLAERPKAPPTKGGGYALSEHVKRYYQTTRV